MNQPQAREPFILLKSKTLKNPAEILSRIKTLTRREVARRIKKIFDDRIGNFRVPAAHRLNFLSLSPIGKTNS